MGQAWSKALSDLKNLGVSSQEPSHGSAGAAPLSPALPETRWTSEQAEVIRCQDPAVRVRALAGTGKTRVLEAYAHRRSGRWRYLTFNQSLAHQAKKAFPAHVKASTFHGLAFPRFGQPLEHRFDLKWETGDLAGVLGRPLDPDAERRWLQVLLRTHEAFTRSASPLILADHVDQTGWRLARACADEVPDTLEDVVRDAERLWAAVLNPSSRLPVHHDVYLKLWCLAEPRLPVDGILVDEDQDLTPALHAWLAQHPGIHVRVGDPHQAIYGFLGAQVQEDQAHETVIRLPHSFRFGAAIAAAANQVLARLGDDRLIGWGPEGEVVPRWTATPHTVLLARTHAGLLEAALEANDQGIALAQVVRLPQRLAAVVALSRGQRDQIRDPWVRGFRDLGALEQAARDNGESEWLAMCRLVKRHPQDLDARIRRLNDTRSDDGWRLATVHGAKGQTYDRVALAPDLPLLPPNSPEGQEETRLLYVAMTRARLGLHLHPAWAQAWAQWSRDSVTVHPRPNLDDSGF